MMSDDATQNAPEEGGNSTGATPAGDDAFKPITSQDDLNRVIADRISRERAKFADYDDLKAKAARLDEIDEQNKSEIQKAIEATQTAEAERDKARAEALRFKVASKHGISDEDAELFLTGTDEKTLTAQAERLSSRTQATSGKPVARREGGEPASRGNDSMRDLARQVFGRND